MRLAFLGNFNQLAVCVCLSTSHLIHANLGHCVVHGLIWVEHRAVVLIESGLKATVGPTWVNGYVGLFNEHLDAHLGH